MRMRSEIDRHPVRKERDVGSVIRIEAAQEVLVRLAGSTRVLDGNESRDEPQDLSRTALRLKEIFFVRNELLRRCRDGTVGGNADFLDIEDVFVGLMSRGGQRHQ